MDSAILLGIIQVAVGGTLVQLIIFLIRRRAEIGKLDAETKAARTSADSTLLTSATAFNSQLTDANTKLTARVEQLELRLADEQTKSRRDLEVAHGEIDRLSRDVSQLRVDLDVANGQVERLRRELHSDGGRHQL